MHVHEICIWHVILPRMHAFSINLAIIIIAQSTLIAHKSKSARFFHPFIEIIIKGLWTTSYTVRGHAPKGRHFFCGCFAIINRPLKFDNAWQPGLSAEEVCTPNTTVVGSAQCMQGAPLTPTVDLDP